MDGGDPQVHEQECDDDDEDGDGDGAELDQGVMLVAHQRSITVPVDVIIILLGPILLTFFSLTEEFQKDNIFSLAKSTIIGRHSKSNQQFWSII